MENCSATPALCKPGPSALHALPLKPGQENHEHVEHRQHDHPDRRLLEIMNDLIHAEAGEYRDRPWKSPELFPEEAVDEHALHDPVRQEVNRGKALVV